MHLIRRCERENCARVLLLSWADAVASVHCVSCTLRPSVHQIAQAHGERVRKGPSFRAASHTKRRRRPPMRPQLSTAATPPREKDEGGKRRRLRGWVGLCCAAAAVIRVNASSSSSSSKSSCSDRTTEGGREGAERGRGLFLQPPLLSAWPSLVVCSLCCRPPPPPPPPFTLTPPSLTRPSSYRFCEIGLSRDGPPHDRLRGSTEWEGRGGERRGC